MKTGNGLAKVILAAVLGSAGTIIVMWLTVLGGVRADVAGQQSDIRAVYGRIDGLESVRKQDKEQARLDRAEILAAIERLEVKVDRLRR